jgi:energy-coupling factor transport system substrate-specific component
MKWGIGLALALLGMMAFIFWRYEKRKTNAREIALVSTLAALAAVSRIFFAALPNIQPTTFIVVTSGFVFGPSFGFMTGAIAAFLSNNFLGHGPWTPWQMLAWGLAGFISGLLRKSKIHKSRLLLTAYAFMWGFMFDWIMNLWHWLFFIYPLNLRSFIAVYAASFYFDMLHAAGNGVFAFFFGKDLVAILGRYKDKLSYERINESLHKDVAK